MADVPDNPVVRCVENVMQGDCQFHDTETRTEVAAGDGDRVDHFTAEFRGKLRKLRFGQGPQISGNLDLVKEGRF